MEFPREHGDYVYARSQQTILFSGRGPWNNETLVKGGKVADKLVAEVDLLKPWGGISCLFGESLFPSSAFNSFVENTRRRKSLGMSGLALVIEDSDIVNTIQNQFGQCYRAADIDFIFLDCIEEAMDWVSNKNIAVDKQHAAQFFQKHQFLSSNYE